MFAYRSVLSSFFSRQFTKSFRTSTSIGRTCGPAQSSLQCSSPRVKPQLVFISDGLALAPHTELRVRSRSFSHGSTIRHKFCSWGRSLRSSTRNSAGLPSVLSQGPRRSPTKQNNVRGERSRRMRISTTRRESLPHLSNIKCRDVRKLDKSPPQIRIEIAHGQVTIDFKCQLSHCTSLLHSGILTRLL